MYCTGNSDTDTRHIPREGLKIRRSEGPKNEPRLTGEEKQVLSVIVLDSSTLQRKSASSSTEIFRPEQCLSSVLYRTQIQTQASPLHRAFYHNPVMIIFPKKGRKEPPKVDSNPKSG